MSNMLPLMLSIASMCNASESDDACHRVRQRYVGPSVNPNKTRQKEKRKARQKAARQAKGK